jgi:phage regulator Rha-like protein
MEEIVPIEIIQNKIYVIRGEKVMLDSDLAQLYDVETRIINRNVKRNQNRFPEDFMFQLKEKEWDSLKSHFGISNKTQGGRRFLPYVFTEHGVLMLSNVLNSERAINVSIQIIKVFNRLKAFALTQNQLVERIGSLEQAFINYTKENNQDIEDLREAINYLLDITKPAKIGFKG